MKKIFIIIITLNYSLVFAQYTESDKRFILETFVEIHELCSADHGKMWGINLDLPCMVIDKETRMIIANSPDNDGLLVREGNTYVGLYPENKELGSSFTEYGRTVFAYVTYPFLFPESYLKVQLIHEIFHIVQDSLKLNPPQLFYRNAHMDNMNARIYLQLEWLALENALITDEPEDRKEHITYALKFRSKRRLMFNDVSKEENYFELNEGLPEYTGHMISSNTFDDYINSIRTIAEMVKPLDSFATTFAYYSGCLYGGLLYTYDKMWNHTLQVSDDLGELLRQRIDVAEIDTLINREFVNLNYNADEITKEEEKRKDKKGELILHYMQTFQEDTVLRITLIKWGMQMFPTVITPLDTLGMVHQKINLFDNWGKLTVNDGGCLVNGNEVSVPARNLKLDGNRLYTENWELILEDDWTVEMKGGNYTLQKR